MTHYSLSDFELFDPKGIRVGTNWRFMCPAPDCDGKPFDDAHRSLSYNSLNGLYNCKRCGLKGKVKEHWTQFPSQPRSPKAQAAARLQNAFHVPTAQPAEKRPPAATSGESGALPEAALDGLPPEAEAQLKGKTGLKCTPAETYLSGRGLPYGYCQAVGVRYAPNFYGRKAIIFPIKNEFGNTIAINSRTIEGEPDLKLSIGPKSKGVFRTLLGLNSPIITICEAPIDALSLRVATGFEPLEAVALCGKDTSADWFLKKCAFRKVYIAFDADAPGDEAAEKLAAKLRAKGADVTRLRPPAKDWNEALQMMGAEALNDFLDPYKPSS